MRLVIEIPNSLYANLSKIQHGSIASRRILNCVKSGECISRETARRIIDSNRTKEQMLDMLENTPSVQPVSVLEDIKSEIKRNILDEPVKGTTGLEMAQFDSALMLTLDIIDKHISGGSNE